MAIVGKWRTRWLRRRARAAGLVARAETTDLKPDPAGFAQRRQARATGLPLAALAWNAVLPSAGLDRRGNELPA